MARTLALLLAMAFCVVFSAEAIEWKTYTNPRFGFRLKYPAQMQLKQEAENGAGVLYVTPDGACSLVAQAHFLAQDQPDSLETRWAEELKEYAGTITYQRKTKEWYVLSGVKADGTEFYRKLYVRDGNWASLDFTYPHARNKEFDPWVEQITKGFVPFLHGEYDRIER